ncbi:MAG: fluoride efflux transporter FluC [Actinomycetota bacterium]
MPPLRHVLLVLLGGSLGALARAALSTAIATPPLSLPLATLVVNVSGAWVLAVLLGALATRLVSEPTGRLLLGTGVLGSFTTYSTLAVEVDGLLRAGAVVPGLGYAALTVLLGLAAAWIGLRNGRRLDLAITRRAGPRNTDRRVPSDEGQRS